MILVVIILLTGLTAAQTPCQGVSNLKVIKTTSYSISVGWGTDDRRTQCLGLYRVCALTSSRPPTCSNITMDSTGFVITGLVPCTNYTVSVEVFTSAGIAFSSLPVRTGPAGVQDLNSTLVNSTSLLLSWSYDPSHGGDCAVGFYAEVCQRVTSFCLGWSLYGTNVTGVLLPGLAVCMLHDIRVFTVDQAGARSDPTGISFYLDGMGPVTNISSRNVTPNSFTVTWLLQSLVAVSCEYNITALKRCTIPCYSREWPDVLQVCAENIDIKTRLCQDLTGGETELTMTGLDDCSRYLVTVMILTQGSNFTSSYTELTTAPSSNVSFTLAISPSTMDMISSISLEESSISLTINWVPVYPNSPCAQVYKVYHTHDISGATISDVVSRNVTTKTLTRLRDNDWYTVRVMAVFNDGSVSRNVSNRGRTLTSGTMWFEVTFNRKEGS
uniref:Fibronectin type-III domain-containing protein n=1 Tax=Timema monikensis TaxID=170555 RepID=A0A7R9ELT4_9NEOP|nr:unnamed protein product [Timema monikensis]